ncbi:MAG: glycerol-3-phosphate dehydrogenase C-terminal domain-containing protein, partial [Pseudomonadota bacterium]
LESNTQAAPLLSIWGGKITTFRKLAEEAADQVGRMLGDARSAWTERASLPGGDFSAWIDAAQRPDMDFERFAVAVRKRYPWLAESPLRRMARSYGSRIDQVLAESAPGMGREVAPGLWEAELDYLRREEWANSADDVLWRRSKLGLHYDAQQRDDVAQWMGTANHPRSAFGASPSRGRHQRPGEAGSAASPEWRAPVHAPPVVRSAMDH